MSNTKPEAIEVTGNCDATCGKPARFWYGSTSAATCGDEVCLNHMDERYAEHCAEMDAEAALEREMIAIYGDPDDY